MLTRKTPEIKTAEITDKTLYLARRQFLHMASTTALAVATAGVAPGLLASGVAAQTGGDVLEARKSLYSTEEALTPYKDVTQYNNFYELSTDKYAPAQLAKALRATPWSVVVEGEIAKPAVYHLEDVLRPHILEERIYRLRCVEGWSMVIPWIGVPLGEVIKRFEPTSKAKYVAFTTLYDPEQLPGQRRAVLTWPYVEGLRMDEAMHPLTILAVGLYGEVLPNQNGAPLRLVVPWKYGFKSVKSIAKIRFVEKQPTSTWMKSARDYYGFYASVNPAPTASTFRDQAVERRLGEFVMRKTLPFNGYGD